MSAGAAGAYAADTIKVGTAAPTCVPGGTEGKICENQMDCEGPAFGCDALVLGVDIVS